MYSELIFSALITVALLKLFHSVVKREVTFGEVMAVFLLGSLAGHFVAKFW
jgi:hypothetical protein